MTSDNTKATNNILEKLDKIIEDKEQEIFDKEEVHIIKHIISIYRTIMSLGTLGIFLKNIIIVAGVIIAGYVAVGGKFVEIVKVIAKGVV